MLLIINWNGKKMEVVGEKVKTNIYSHTCVNRRLTRSRLFSVFAFFALRNKGKKNLIIMQVMYATFLFEQLLIELVWLDYMFDISLPRLMIEHNFVYTNRALHFEYAASIVVKNVHLKRT